MYTDDAETPSRQRAIAFLAQETRAPISVVTQLYNDEWAKLASGARITRFISILTLRNVRRVLRQAQRLPNFAPRRT